MSGVFWPAALAMVVNYALVLVVGVAAGRASPKATGTAAVEDMMLAGRGLPLWIGVMTTTATWVGGGYINGTAEASFSRGLLWGMQAGVGYALSLVVGGLLYARTMRRHNYYTLVDPLEQRYGRGLSVVFMATAVLSELIWTSAALLALGTTFGTVAGIEDLRFAIIGSAAVAILYTAFGGLRAVAWTDVLQLFLLLFGLGIAVPFAVGSAGGLWTTLATHGGGLTFHTSFEAVSWFDFTILLILGGIPWNCYFQRVLASPDEQVAVRISTIAGLMCALAVIPPMLLGLSAAAFHWTPEQAAQIEATPALVLPYYLRYGTPTVIAVLALGAVAAAVMSSVDSSILSASSMLAWNLYRRLLRPQASAREVELVVKGLVISLGTVATITALTVRSVTALWFLCGDIVYVALFPQLTLAMFDPKVNRAGAAAGLAVAAVLRMGGGEPSLGLPGFLPYPDWDGQFPFRTLAMISSVVVTMVVSRLTTQLDPPRALVPLEN